MTARARIVAAAGLLVAAAAVRLFRLDHFSYGLDEILQGFFIQGDSRFFWKTLKFDAIHPPLDYLVARFLELFGPADWARKLPAVAWGVGTVGAIGLLVARRTERAAAGWMAALLLAFAPFHVRYSQEFRPYSLGLFLLVLSLLLLDRYLDKPGPLRLVGLWLACLATMYALYFAALILSIAAVALVVEDAFSRDGPRSRTARRFLLWSPAFAGTIFLSYLPWWPVVLEAARRPPPVPAPPLSWDRLTRLLSFFSFAPDDGQPLGRKGPFYLLLVISGLVIAWRRPKLRFLVVWPVAGFFAIEILGHLPPHWS